jgi:hypothetical protein
MDKRYRNYSIKHNRIVNKEKRKFFNIFTKKEKKLLVFLMHIGNNWIVSQKWKLYDILQNVFNELIPKKKTFSQYRNFLLWSVTWKLIQALRARKAICAWVEVGREHNVCSNWNKKNSFQAHHNKNMKQYVPNILINYFYDFDPKN